MAKEIVHEDFGEKIGGAKKDLWAARGLYVDDLLGMNEREADKYVKKDNVWKKPDYNALIQSGVPVDILYFRKVVRDSLNASPRYLRSDDTPEKRLARQKEYIATVRQVQEAVEKVQTIQEAMGVFESLIIGGGYCERISHGIGGGYIRATPKGRDNPVITDKLVNALYFRGTQDFDRKIVREAVKKQFGVPAEQKVPRGYDIRFNDGKRTYSKNNDWLPDTYAVLREEFLLGVPGSVEQLNDFKKSVTGRVIPKSERDRLEIFEHMLSGMQTQEPPQIGRVETDFYKNSIRMGKECEKDGGYWESNTEMTARAFACYIKDKLAPEISDYLAGHADSAATFATGKDGKMEILKAFPEGEERKAINAVFDEVFADLKREHFLTHSDHPQTLEETRPVAAPTPSRMDSMPVITDVEQLSLFGGEKPSILGQLAATKEQSKTPAAPKQNKTHEPEL